MAVATSAATSGDQFFFFFFLTALEGWRLRPSPPPKIPRFDCSLLQSNPALPEMEGQDIFAVIDGKDTGIPGDFGGHKKEGGRVPQAFALSASTVSPVGA